MIIYKVTYEELYNFTVNNYFKTKELAEKNFNQSIKDFKDMYSDCTQIDDCFEAKCYDKFVYLTGKKGVCTEKLKIYLDHIEVKEE